MAVEQSEYVDFEIAFSALLATLAIYISTELFSYEQIVESIAIILIVLTLVRRVGLMNGLNSDHLMFFISTHLMSGISYIVMFYLLYWVSEKVSAIVSYDVILVFVLLPVPLVLAVIIIQEVAIGGFMKASEEVFDATSIENKGTLGGEMWGRLSDIARESRTDVADTYQARLSEYQNSKQFSDLSKEKQRAVLEHILGSVIGMLSPFIVYGFLGLILAISLNLSVWLSLWVVFCFHIITVPVDIWFSGYGLIQLNETGWLPKVVTTTVGIVFCFYTLPL